MYQEMRTKDDAWMQSIHESIDQLSEIIDSIPKDGATLPNDDEYMCDKEVAYMLKVSRRTLSEYRSNGTLPYYVLGGKVLYKRSEIEQALKREYNGTHDEWQRIIPSIFLEGAKFTACPYFHLMQNNSAPMDRYKNSIQMGYQCKNPLYAVCLFIYIFVSRSFPLPSAVLSTGLKGERFSG